MPPEEVTQKETPLPIFQKGLTFRHQRLPQCLTLVNPPQILAMGAREKDQEDYMGVLDILPLLGGEPLA